MYGEFRRGGGGISEVLSAQMRIDVRQSASEADVGSGRVVEFPVPEGKGV